MEEEAGSTDQLGFGDCPAFWSEGSGGSLRQGHWFSLWHPRGKALYLPLQEETLDFSSVFSRS